MMRLPRELVLECLIRLPGKQLGRCMCVCKSWRSIIGSPPFLKAYRKRPPMLLLMCSPERAYTTDENDILFRHFGSTLLRPDDKLIERFSPLSKFIIRTNPQCVGLTNEVPVNGLICVCDEGDVNLTIHNVCTGQKMRLPDPAGYPGEPISSYHLGYDGASCKYKLLRLIHPLTLSGDYRPFGQPLDQPLQAEIMNLSPSDSLSKWRKLDDDACVIDAIRSARFHSLGARPVSGNGFICWFLVSELVYFDLNKEKFQLVKLPEDVQDEIGSREYVFSKSMGLPAILVLRKNSAKFLCAVLLVFENDQSNMWNKYHLRLPKALGNLDYRIVDAGSLLTGEMLVTNVCKTYPDHCRPVYSYNHHTGKFDRFLVGELPNRPFPDRLRFLTHDNQGQNIILLGDFTFNISCLHDSNALYLPLDDVLRGGVGELAEI